MQDKFSDLKKDSAIVLKSMFDLVVPKIRNGVGFGPFFTAFDVALFLQRAPMLGGKGWRKGEDAYFLVAQDLCQCWERLGWLTGCKGRIESCTPKCTCKGAWRFTEENATQWSYDQWLFLLLILWQ